MGVADGFATKITRWPFAFDAERGQDVAARYGASGALGDLIAGVAGASPYLHDLLCQETDWLPQALEAPEAALAALVEDASAEAMRRDKRRMALLVALHDLGGIWSLEEVTGALSDFADRALDLALKEDCAPLQARGLLPEEPGLTALAMGKLGARELNYSSDIDLILLMDDEGLPADAAMERRRHLVRAARGAMKRLSDVTRGGYVFRTDLRLRPDAAVTPIVVSMRFAMTYYESVGRTWERAAFIKARANAGDRDAGAQFLKALDPFIWRRQLDFAAIEDAHDILLKIRAHHGLSGSITLPGHDMKLGRGGIREIEFFAQTRQLISGGRDRSLRPRETRAALKALSAAGWVAPDVTLALDAAYGRHREVEHRLQMLRDAQTHALPGTEEGFARLAAFMGRDLSELQSELRSDLEAVHALTEPFFAPKAQSGGAESQAFGKETTERWLTYPALRSARAIRVFERVKPRILDRLSSGAAPEQALRHFDAFLAGLPAGVQVFSLFEANPQLIDLLTDIAAVAPALAEYLGRNASVLDSVLGGAFFAPWPGCAALTEDLAGRLEAETDYEAQLVSARLWQKDWHFRIGVHFLRGLIEAEEAGAQYADLAEATLAGLWPHVTGEFARKHGPAPGQGAAILAMGSLGAGRLHSASDLDLLLIYDAEGVDASDGLRPLATRPYFARLTQALITALSAPMAGGRLYEVDMRLRPSGRNGPVAVSVESWEGYQRADAWTWEHLALTRARAVAGPEALRARIEAFRAELLKERRDKAATARDVAEMRARIAAARPGDALSVKDGAGRLQDVELFAQTLALLAGSPAREVSGQIAAGGPDHAALEEQAVLLWRLRAATQLIGLTDSGPDALVELGPAGVDFVLRATRFLSEMALQDALRFGAEATEAHVDGKLAAWGDGRESE